MEFIDLKAQYRQYQGEIDHKVLEVMGKAHFILGEEVGAFEGRAARYVGRRHAVACSDGTSALQLAYMAYGVGPGDAVFCPDMTFIATVEPACLMGATPVFCDIDRVSYNIDPESLERQVGRVEKEGRLRPRAVVAVDFLGNPADYGALGEIARRHGLLLIEDAAQGMGAGAHGRRC
ncbi:aminotransferase class I/II-fold pyridoxal phosphate-dependent enzyme, partial [Clostridiaceae bacterium]